MSKHHSPAFLALVSEAKKGVKEITLNEFQQWTAKGRPFHLIDVREDNEWKAGHIPNAEHVGKGVIERDIEKAIPNKKETLVLYCGGGYRSALAANALQKMGYTEVYSLDGGYRAWKAASS